MQIHLQTEAESRQYLENLQKHAEKHPLCATKYLDLGCRTVRLMCRTPEILPHLEKQLSFTIRDSAPHFDTTIVIWQETDSDSLIVSLDNRLDPKKNMRMRLEKLMNNNRNLSLGVFDFSFSQHTPLINIMSAGIVEAVNPQTRTFYYGVQNLEPEEFIKQGHVLVQLLNNIVKDAHTNLVHGAVIGKANNGILFCARGQRGKSTLTVLSMLKGFEYVSDDYLILQSVPEGLRASPIYSIITLSPKMYNELYNELNGKFVSNNARKDKYVLNISAYHEQFKVNYPVKMCIFPEISPIPEPKIYPCDASDKGRAIVQLIQSTVSQMRDCNDKAVIKKLLEMVCGLPFYKMELCPDIWKNTAFLSQFLKNWKPDDQNISLERVLTDITFDIANILDVKTCTLYTMNKFATNLYENLLCGVSAEDLKQQLKNLGLFPQNFDLFIKTLQTKGFLSAKTPAKRAEIKASFAKEDKCKLSVLEYAETETIELINERS